MKTIKYLVQLVIENIKNNERLAIAKCDNANSNERLAIAKCDNAMQASAPEAWDVRLGEAFAAYTTQVYSAYGLLFALGAPPGR